MSEHTLKSIKRDSIRRVYDCISNSEYITRLEISRMTGLSLMTVGKITDALLEKKIILLEKSDSSSIGRKAEYIKLNKACAAIVMEDGRISLVSVSAEIVAEQNYIDIDSAIKFLIENSLENTYMGMALLDENIPSELVENIMNLFGCSDRIKLDTLTARAVDEMFTLKRQAKSGLYVCSDSHISYGACFDADTTVDSIRLGEIIGENDEQKAQSIAAVAKFTGSKEIFFACDMTELEKHINAAVIALNSDENCERVRIGAARVLVDAYINITKRL